MLKKITFILIVSIIAFLPLKMDALTASGDWFSSQGSGSLFFNFSPGSNLVRGNISGNIFSQKIEKGDVNGSLHSDDNSINGTVFINTTEHQLSGYFSGNIKPVSGEGSGYFIINHEDETLQANWNVNFSAQAYKNELTNDETITSQETDNNEEEDSEVVGDAGVTTGEIIFYVLIGLGVIGLVLYIIKQGKAKKE